jgi:hypothetical protein
VELFFEDAVEVAGVFDFYNFPVGADLFEGEDVKAEDGVAVADDDADGESDIFELFFGDGQVGDAAEESFGGAAGLSGLEVFPELLQGAAGLEKAHAAEGGGLNALGVKDHELGGHHAAERIAGDVGLLDLQVVEQEDHILGHLRAVGFVVVGLVGFAVAGEVGEDDEMVLGEGGDDTGESPVEVAAGGQPVNEEDRSAGGVAAAHGLVVDLDAGGVEEAGVVGGGRGDKEEEEEGHWIYRRDWAAPLVR